MGSFSPTFQFAAPQQYAQLSELCLTIARRGKTLFLVVGLSVLSLSSFATGVVLPLDDSPDGMTCHYYSKVARLGWQQQGGDWTDAMGETYGGQPYAQEIVSTAKSLQVVQFDVVGLTKDWMAGKVSPGVVFLRTLGGTGSGVVDFHSREHADFTLRPKLSIVWDDGTQSELAATADAHFSCPNHRSYGAMNVVKVGGKYNAVIVFPFVAQKGRSVVSATLQLATEKAYRNPSTVGVYALQSASSDGMASKAGIAAQFPADVSIESHPDVIFADQFEGRKWQSFWTGIDSRDTVEMVSVDRENLFEPLQGKALRVTIPKGVSTALNAHIRFAGHADGEPEEAYFRYYLRFAENWNPTLDGGKLPGFSGTYGRAGWGMRKSDGTNGWSTRGAFFQQGRSPGPLGELRGIGSYVYHADMDGLSGSTLGWNLGPSGLLQKNRWYSIEQRVRMNALGKADGVLQAWVDGQLVFERTNIRYREVPDLKIESVWMNVYHGGARPAPHDMTLYIDNLVVARKYIGPMKVSD